MVVNDGIILEIVTPGGGDPVAPGKVGEIVVTRLNADYPLLRFATGDLSALIQGAGAAHQRLAGARGSDRQGEGHVRPAGARAAVGKRHPELGVLRLVVRRADEQDQMTLLAEALPRNSDFIEAVAATLLSVTKLRGAVELRAPGSLPERWPRHRRRTAGRVGRSDGDLRPQRRAILHFPAPRNASVYRDGIVNYLTTCQLPSQYASTRPAVRNQVASSCRSRSPA